MKIEGRNVEYKNGIKVVREEGWGKGGTMK